MCDGSLCGHRGKAAVEEDSVQTIWPVTLCMTQEQIPCTSEGGGQNLQWPGMSNSGNIMTFLLSSHLMEKSRHKDFQLKLLNRTYKNACLKMNRGGGVTMGVWDETMWSICRKHHFLQRPWPIKTEKVIRWLRNEAAEGFPKPPPFHQQQ